MCKHQSGGKNSDHSANDISGDCTTSSTSSECQNKTPHPVDTDCIVKSCSKFHSQIMAARPQCIPSSTDKNKLEDGDLQQPIKEILEGKLNENSRDNKTFEKISVLPCIPPHTASWQNHRSPLQQLDDSDLARRNSIPAVHNLTESHFPQKKKSCALDMGLKSLKCFLKFREDLQQEPNNEAGCIYSIPNGSDRTAHLKKDDKIPPYTQSRHYSIEQSWFIPKQIILDEVLHKGCVPKVTAPSHDDANFPIQSNVESESLIKRSYTDLSKMLPTNTAAMEFGPDTIVLQRRSSSCWEVSSNTGIQCSLSASDFAAQDTVNETDASYPSTDFQKRNSYVPSERRLTEITIHPAVLSRSSIARQSLASSFGDGGGPICKICHMVGREGDPLISPCRCSGTMQFIHCGCLMKWLEISSRRSRKPPTCELCHYQYQWHKKFKVRHWQFPECSRRDTTLHLVFFFSVLVMIACATITILCFKQDKGTKIDPDRTELTHSEIVTLICGVLFFLAFFLGMYAEIKATNTIYKLIVKFVYLNQQWYIDEYNKAESSTAKTRQDGSPSA